jgi:RNA polymerase sigma factor (sigma-70 family)
VSLPPFEHVVTEHARVVLRVCRALLPDHDAQDAAAETFVSALRAYPRLRPDSDVRAWLVTIAHRKAVDITRAMTRRAIPTDTVPDSPDTPAPERDDDLVDALARLPDKQKQAVAYHYLGGLPYSDVATILGGSTDSARRSAADGIAALRRSYPRGTTS